MRAKQRRRGKFLPGAVVLVLAEGGTQLEVEVLSRKKEEEAMKAFKIGMAVLAAVAAMTTVAPAFAGQTQAEREWVLRQRAESERAPGWQMAPAKEMPLVRPNPIVTGGWSRDGNCHCGDQRN
jgi:hypothetical protein